MSGMPWAVLSVAVLSIPEAYAKGGGKGKSSGSSSGTRSRVTSTKNQTTKCRDTFVPPTSTACNTTMDDSSGTASHTKKIIGIVLACVIPSLCLLTILFVHLYYARRKRRGLGGKSSTEPFSRAEYQELRERLDLTPKDNAGHHDIETARN
ncbi:hypothetical protein GALMADRAFT_905935 [Galerina marginata CBS 339.88]|uniref:Mid2 domain-containing protein n=1 Tax=Galerina marginata (strain CBS 339.88) TaxID=685588 RepID=A0A067SQY7_GALM3|nr:hypothetical protein GALMADRAFT_905935 [Galerina marginata CBS 339.88]